ncbi:hypothetical protein I35_1280 [Burkholderia cenocepacia H111]|nr:hypothetical protein I35_1280 [Burkholderia cenocepacia H111]
MHARPAAHARRAEPRNAGAAGCAPDGSCLNFFKFVAACRRSAIIGRFAVARCCVAANAPVGGVIIGCCTSARLQFESISLRLGQRIIASFAKKRQIGAARPAACLTHRGGSATMRAVPARPAKAVSPPGASRREMHPTVPHE